MSLSAEMVTTGSLAMHGGLFGTSPGCCRSGEAVCTFAAHMKSVGDQCAFSSSQL